MYVDYCATLAVLRGKKCATPSLPTHDRATKAFRAVRKLEVGGRFATSDMTEFLLEQLQAAYACVPRRRIVTKFEPLGKERRCRSSGCPKVVFNLAWDNHFNAECNDSVLVPIPIPE